jgi:hypothetical protein
MVDLIFPQVWLQLYANPNREKRICGKTDMNTFVPETGVDVPAKLKTIFSI